MTVTQYGMPICGIYIAATRNLKCRCENIFNRRIHLHLNLYLLTQNKGMQTSIKKHLVYLYSLWHKMVHHWIDRMCTGMWEKTVISHLQFAWKKKKHWKIWLLCLNLIECTVFLIFLECCSLSREWKYIILFLKCGRDVLSIWQERQNFGGGFSWR